MKAYDVVGYTYQADILCPSCVRYVAASVAEQHGHAADFVPLDRLMTAWASIAGFDAEDESSYDSDDFPKVIFAAQVDDDGESCAECGEELI